MKKEQIKDYSLKHSASHLMASAVKELYPKAKLAIGPPVEDGFYYDFDNLNISDEDLPKIEKKMREVAGKNLPFKKSETTKKKAESILKSEKYKKEILSKLKGKVTFYEHGDFIDLCEGPHVKSTKDLQNFKLMSVAGAYWRGDSKNKMLTRIYGVVFNTKKELKDYLSMLAEAKKRDHRKLGSQLGLFMAHEWSPGSTFFYPKGAFIFNRLVKLMRDEYEKRGYQEVISPQLYDNKLWETSGHIEAFKDDMFTLKIDKRDYAIKPMNCPGHMLMYKSTLRSYKDLPLRLADFSPLHRNELKGVLGGLTRVRKMCQDDAHIFVAPEQLESELNKVLDFIHYIYKDIFNFTYSINFSTKPDKAIGDPKLWAKAETALKSVLTKKKIKFELKEGEGAFYGPKIDVDIKDSLGRKWQCATVQLDFQLPNRFELTYESQSGRKETPIVIHRAILGSVERFMGVYIEHTAGNFPLWISPVQVKVMTVTDRNNKFAERIAGEMRKEGIRVELDQKSHSIGKKVRDAQIEKVNYMITVGDKEQKAKTLAVRTRDGKVKFGVKVDKFIKDLKKEIENKDIK